MTDNTQISNEKPNRKLIQEKAFYKTQSNGKQTHEVKQIEISVGWEKEAESGVVYTSWADSVTPILPDVDGRIVLRTFQINSEDEA